MVTVKKYNIVHADNTPVINGGLPANTSNKDAMPIVLIGKELPEYGEIQNNNFVWITENFADIKPPLHPTIGMNWFDKSDLRLKSYTNGLDGSSDLPRWRPFAYLNDKEPADPASGELWWNAQEKALYAFDKNTNRGIKVGPGNVDITGSASVTPETSVKTPSTIVTVIDPTTLLIGKTYNVTMTVIAKALGANDIDISMGSQTVMGWKMNFLMNTYYTDSALTIPEVKIIGDVARQMIAASSANDWEIIPEVSGGTLRVSLHGTASVTPSNTKGRVVWLVVVEYYMI